MAETKVENWAEIKYGDWAEAAVKEMESVPEVAKDSSFDEKYRHFRAEEQNRKIRVLAEETRRKQAEAYGLTEIMETGVREVTAEEAAKLDAEKQGKSAPAHTDPWHLSEDADFHDIDKEGVEFIMERPATMDCFEDGSDPVSLKLTEALTSMMYEGQLYDGRYGRYIVNHIDPRLKVSDPERYIRKTAYVLPPVCSEEELVEARKAQFARDDSEAAAAIDAALREKA